MTRSPSWSCCDCGGDADCFFGVNADDGATACNHSISEELIFKKERKRSFTQITNYSYTEDDEGHDCTCKGEYVTATYFPASSDVVIKYEHFNNNDPAELWTWYYEPFYDLYPKCLGDCCTSSAGSSDDIQCCDGSVLSLCATDYFQPNGDYCSKYQKQVISQGDAPPRSSNAAADDCVFGDQYKFLQGVANMTTTRYWKNWGVNVDGEVFPMALTNKFAETVVAVFRREHWYERYYNSLSQADNEHASDTDNTAAPCGSPKWWVFGCSAQWVTTQMIMQESSLSDPGAFLIKIWAGDPIPDAWMETLESDGIITPIKDWDQPGGELMKKSLTYYDSAGRGETTVTEYFYPAPGGWTYVCYDFSTGSDQDALDLYFPQIDRRTSETCDIGMYCHTAAPYPSNNAVCVTGSWGDDPEGECDPCSGVPGMGDCVNPVISTCSPCSGDVIIGSCRGVWAQGFAYYLGTSTEEYHLNYKCSACSTSGPTGEPCDGLTSEPWNAYLCRIKNEGDTCAWPELPDFMSHETPSLVAGSMRADTSDEHNLCCGARGSVNYFGTDCPGDEPTSPDCDDPPTWGPDI